MFLIPKLVSAKIIILAQVVSDRSYRLMSRGEMGAGFYDGKIRHISPLMSIDDHSVPG